MNKNLRILLKRILFAILVLSVLFLIFLPIISPHIFDPNTYREQIQKQFADTVGKPTVLGKMGLDLNLLNPAVSVKDIKISPDSLDEFKSDNIELNLQILPMLRKKLIIDNITISNPQALAYRDSEGELHYPFQEFLKKPAYFKEIDVGHIDLSSGSFIFTDKLRKRVNKIYVQNIDLKGNFHKFTTDKYETKVDANIEKLTIKEINHPDIPFYVKNISLNKSNFNTDKDSVFDLKVKNGKYMTVPFSGIIGQGTWRDPDLDIKKISVNFADGSFNAHGKMHYYKSAAPSYSLNFTCDAVNTEKLIKQITQEKALITGVTNIKGQITNPGKEPKPFTYLNGKVTFNIHKGDIRKFELLGKIFAVTNPVYLIKGLPDIEKKGFSFDSIDGDFVIKNGVINTQNLMLRSPSWKVIALGDINIVEEKLNLDVYILPLQATATLINKIPGLRYILLGRKGGLLSTYIEVRGGFANPQITPRPISELASDIWGVMSRTLDISQDLLKSLPVPKALREEG